MSDLQPFGRSKRASGRSVIHRTSSTFTSRDGREYVKWQCGTYAPEPILFDELPPFLPLCPTCKVVALDVPSGVYFARRDGLIKIGCSSRPA